MTRALTFLAAALSAALPLSAQQPAPHEHTPGMQHSNNDSAFAAVQQRGAKVMGVDQTTSRHVFESLPDGGRIELQRSVEDSAGVVQIRQHLAEVAAQFERGEFSAPFLVHAQEVPGTRVMAAKGSAITYTVRPLERGGEIRIRTTDHAAVDAVHEFLAFQRSDHRAPGH
jgi:hypothetical protein